MHSTVRAAEFYFESALGKDEANAGEEALPMYKLAADFYLEGARIAGTLKTPEGEKKSLQYRKQILAILSRAEELSSKKVEQAPAPPTSKGPSTDSNDRRNTTSTIASLPAAPAATPRERNEELVLLQNFQF